MSAAQPDFETPLHAAIADYMMRCDSSHPSPRDATLAAHPEIANELRLFFADEDAIGLQGSNGSHDEYFDEQPAPLELLPSFDGFELIEQVGRGGMGVVYKARQADLNRYVAIKMARKNLRGDNQAMLAEARRVATLSHPNIVPIYGVGHHADTPYFYMEFVEGRTLKEIVRDHPLPPMEAAKYVIKICRATQYVHDQETLHRDIKPANIIVDHSDEPRLTDFGLACWQDEQLERERRFAGTLSYLAPEQARGDKATTASDVYSLGATLYELLVGAPPFTGSSANEILQQLAHEKPASPRSLNRSIPQDLADICLQCLRKDPAQRYAAASDLADDIERFCNGEPVWARPVGIFERVIKWGKRNPLSSILAILLGLVMVASFAAVSTALLNTVAALGREQKALVTSEQSEYRLSVLVAHREWLANNPSGAKRYLAECAEEYRDWEWHYCDRLFHSEVLTLKNRAVFYDTVVFSPDGKLVSAGGGPEQLDIWNATTGKLIHELGANHALQGIDNDRHVKQINFNQNSKLLATLLQGGSIEIWDTTTGKREHQFGSELTGDNPRFMQLSPNGQLIGVAGVHLRDKAKIPYLRVLQVEDAKPIWEHNADARVFAFSEDSSKLIATCLDKQIRTWDVTSSEEIASVNIDAACRDGTFSRDLQLFASHFRDTVHVWNTRTGETISNGVKQRPMVDTYTKNYFNHSLAAIMFSPTNNLLAIANERRSIEIRAVASSKATTLRTIRGHGNPPTAVAFSPDGKQLAVSMGSPNGQVIIWNALTPQNSIVFADAGAPAHSHPQYFDAVAFTSRGEIARVTNKGYVGLARPEDTRMSRFNPSSGKFCSVAISPDDKTLIAISRNHTVDVWNLTTASHVETWKSDERALRAAFSPSGRYLATIDADTDDPFDTGPIVIHETNSWQQVGSIKTSSEDVPTTGAFCLLSDNELIYSGINGLVSYSIASGESTQTIPQPVYAISVAVNHAETEVAFVTTSGAIEAWDLSRQTLKFKINSRNLLSLAYSPDGRRIASGGKDGMLRIWNAETGDEVLKLPGHTAAITHVKFSPDGKILASTSDDGTTQLWRGYVPAAPAR